ncbi:hypothetical protein B808_557 [Fructilactobacillus florum 8D]|uniref:Uncharacterized protein n=2 Tax=Fructilactobacillus florum TaxID=640331 RepID=W9ELF5_9LACO|nr:hypothetical protein [Fructilactobacillus florum]ETO40504.1 hypothetical protein B808_557 [Fructilactobacillus florum 8D]
MTLKEPIYRSQSVGMVKVGIKDGDQIIANVIGNNVITISSQLHRATVTGPDRAGRYGIGEYVYFIIDKHHHPLSVPKDKIQQYFGA